MTSTTSTTASPSSNSTSPTDARMPPVRSLSTATSTAAGIAACRRGSSFLIPSTTAMTLEPGWRCTFRMTAGVRLAQAASWLFSAPSTTVAMSPRRTARPFL